MPGHPLPLLQLRQFGTSLAGKYAPANMSGSYGFKDGQILGDKVVFAVQDELQQRMHFRMEMLPGGDAAKLEAWITAEDGMKMIENARKLAKTPRELLVIGIKVQTELDRFKKPVKIGTFKRVIDPGEMR